MKQDIGKKMNFVFEEEPETLVALKKMSLCSCGTNERYRKTVTNGCGRCTKCGCMGFEWKGSSDFCGNCGHHRTAHL